MPNTTNPSNTWQRLALEVWRLSNWARKYGTEQHKDAVQELVASLNKLAPHFEFFVLPADKYARSTRNDPPAKLEQSYDQAALNAAYMAGFTAKAGDVNPYADEPQLFEMWNRGLSHANSQE